MKHVVISGYYGFSNMGDEAILDSIVGSLREQAAKQGEGLEFTVLSADPAGTAARLGVNAVSRMNLPAILRALTRADALISGGGGLLQDTTGRGFSVPYYLGLVFLARLFGKKAIFYAQGIGPVKRPFNRLLVRLAGNFASHIAVRDEGSRKELAALGVTRPPVTVTVDPVFLLKPAEPAGELTAFIQEIPANQPVIGVSIRSWRNEQASFKEIAAAVDCIARDIGAAVILVPMHYPEDVHASERLAACLKTPVFIPRFRRPPREILRLFARFDLVLAMRLHALIFAAVAGVPMVGIGYDRKVDALLARLEMKNAGEPGDLAAADLSAHALEAWGEREKIKGRLRVKSAEFDRAAQEWAAQAYELIRR